MSLRLLQAPVGKVMTLEAMKLHLRVDHDDEDDDIQALIDEAESRLDGYSGILGRALLSQKWAQDLDAFPIGPINLRLPPLISVEKVSHVDLSGERVEIDLDTLIIHPGPFGMVECAPGGDWPAARAQRNAVTVEFTCGYGVAGDIPEGIIRAIKVMCWHAYEERGAVDPSRASALLNPFTATWL